MLFLNLTTNQWKQLVRSNLIGYLAWSADSRYVYFDTLFEQNPVYQRVHVPDGKIETIVAMKRMRTFPSQFGPGSWTGLAPGEVPLFVRDTSAQEMYAFDLQLQ